MACNCFMCGVEISNDVVSLNKKMIDRNIKKMMCVKCMSDKFDLSETHLMGMITQFKEIGCSLFEHTSEL